MRTELRAVPHSIRSGVVVHELWYGDEFVASLIGAEWPGVRLISKHAIEIRQTEHGPLNDVLIVLRVPRRTSYSPDDTAMDERGAAIQMPAPEVSAHVDNILSRSNTKAVMTVGIDGDEMAVQIYQPPSAELVGLIEQVLHGLKLALKKPHN